MKLCSFDVGIKNLAYSITEDSVIHHWEVFDISYNSNEGLCVALVKALNLRPHLLQCHRVIIEKQPSRNNKMRIVEHLLQAYFIIKGVLDDNSPMAHATTYSPKHKLGSDSHKGASGYRERKKLGVQRCKAFLEQTQQPSPIMELFAKSKKQDDLADCLLQALSFTKNATFASISSGNHSIPPAFVTPRKPTPAQLRKLLSKSNLKWLFLNSSIDSLSSFEVFIKDNKPVEKALRYWYKSDSGAALSDLAINFDTIVSI